MLSTIFAVLAMIKEKSAKKEPDIKPLFSQTIGFYYQCTTRGWGESGHRSI